MLEKEYKLPYHRISYADKLLRDGAPVHMAIHPREEYLRIGCTRVTFKALEHIYKVYKAMKSDEEIVLQSGEK